MNMEINPSEYKILIVDDVMSNVLLLKVLLTNEKFAIATANNGRQALEQVDKEHPDLVLLDVMMPDLSGFEVAQRLKSNPDTADIPIIFLTALNSTTDIVKGFQAGASDFISKPFNKEELIIRVTHQVSLVAAKRIILNKTEELQRIIAGRDKLYSVDAVEVVDSVIDVFNMVAGLKKITIREEKPEKLPVCTDIDMLKTIIRNLLSNAIKFSNENSEVLVKMEEQGDTVVVSVKDSGCGIDEEGQKKLLHTDTHFSTFGTNNEEGSGLGLLLCQDFAVKSGGKLWFTSKKGEGSTFYFSIPLKK